LGFVKEALREMRNYPVPPCNPLLPSLPWTDFFEKRGSACISRIFTYFFVTILNASSKQVSILTPSPISSSFSLARVRSCCPSMLSKRQQRHSCSYMGIKANVSRFGGTTDNFLLMCFSPKNIRSHLQINLKTHFSGNF